MDEEKIKDIEEYTDESAAEDLDEDALEVAAAESVEQRKRLKNPAYNGLLPITLLAGLIGLILGPVPSALFTLLSNSANVLSSGDVTGNIFYPLFVAAPLIIYLFNFLLKGGRDFRAIIVIAFFSLVSAYLTMLMCFMITLYTIGYEMTFSMFWVQVIESVGRLDYLPITVNASAYVYPLVFTALGVAVSALLLRGKTHENSEFGIRNSELEDEGNDIGDDIGDGVDGDDGDDDADLADTDIIDDNS